MHQVRLFNTLRRPHCDGEFWKRRRHSENANDHSSLHTSIEKFENPSLQNILRPR